jgi:CheY-like chemotaxis protein
VSNDRRTSGEVLLDGGDILAVYDPAALDEFIADLGEDGEGVKEGLFAAFLDDSTNRFVDLVTAPSDAKGDVLGAIAHALRSASATLGLLALSAASAEIETAVRATPRVIDISLASSRLLNEFQRATVAIGGLLAADRRQGWDTVAYPGPLPTVLLVEDDPVSQKACSAVLTKLGYNTKIAVNGAQALKDLERHRYAAVLMDFRMPVLDGFLTTRELRKREGSAHHTPVIALTSPTTEWDREICLEAGGMDDYLTKPVDVALLSAALAYWVHEER